MYKKFFGLTENPFNLSPDPRFFFSTQATSDAFSRLVAALQARKGLILLTGEVGTGKTILLKKLADRLYKEFVATAFVFSTTFNPVEFLDFVLADFGVEHDSKDEARMVKVLNQWLQERFTTGHATVLLVDEAQNLHTEVFEQIRLLANLGTPPEKLVQIILAGQPELEERLKQPRLRPIEERVAFWCRIYPLTRDETVGYVEHRVRVAGGDIKEIFSDDALESIAELSEGIPRVINVLGEHALIAGYAGQVKPVTAATVNEVAQRLDHGTVATPTQPIPETPAKAQSADVSAAPAVTLEQMVPAGPQGGTAPPKPSRPVSRPSADRAPVNRPDLASPVSRQEPSRPNEVAPLIDSVPIGNPRAASGAATNSLSIKPRQSALTAAQASSRAPSRVPPPARATTERPKILEYGLLALVTIGLLGGGYYIMRGDRAAPTESDESPPAEAQAPAADNDQQNPPAAPSSESTAPPDQNSAPQQSSGDSVADKGHPAPSPPDAAKVQPASSPANPSRKPTSENAKTSNAKNPAPAAEAQPQSLPGGQLSVASNVSGAAIMIDGRGDPEWTTPHTFTNLPPGHHNVVVARQGFRQARQSVNIESGETASLNIPLSPPSGEIDISTVPPGAEVIIDGKAYGPSPVHATVDVGQHSFSVQGAGREPVAGNFTVQDQAIVTRSIELPLVVEHTTTGTNVIVTTNPTSAKIYADGKLLEGSTPASFRLSPGRHTLIIFASGYRPLRREIEVPESGAVKVDETLSTQ